MEEDDWGPDTIVDGYGLHNISRDSRTEGVLAFCPTRAAAEAAMRLFGGRELGYYVIPHVHFTERVLKKWH